MSFCVDSDKTTWPLLILKFKVVKTLSLVLTRSVCVSSVAFLGTVIVAVNDPDPSVETSKGSVIAFAFEFHLNTTGLYGENPEPTSTTFESDLIDVVFAVTVGAFTVNVVVAATLPLVVVAVI